MALSIAKPYFKPDIEIVYQVFPMVKGFETDTAAWEPTRRRSLNS